MKKVIFAVSLLAVILLGGCTLSLPDISTTSAYEYEYRTTVPQVPEETSAQPSVPEETTSDLSAGETTLPAEITTEVVTQAPIPEETTAAEPASDVVTEPVSIPPEMDLSISMPEKNGTMVTDKSADNKFIKLISDERRIDSSLLVAVYAVPESGQNYVFQFSDEVTRTADSLKKVYLIDAEGNITGVAASDSSAKENLSTVENWFCMNVLIKGVIFPAMEKDIK